MTDTEIFEEALQEILDTNPDKETDHYEEPYTAQNFIAKTVEAGHTGHIDDVINYWYENL